MAELLAEHIAFSTEGQLLEGILTYPGDLERGDLVILIPPHPNFAGTLENNVIEYLSNHLAALGYLTLCYNYPGIGKSEIDLPNGESTFDFWDKVEQEQLFDVPKNSVLAAVGYAEENLKENIKDIHLIGYSFGGIMALLAGLELPVVKSISAISTPFIERYDYAFLAELKSPKFFLSGTKDFVLDREIFNQVIKKTAKPVSYLLLEGEDHFFRGKEELVFKKIKEFLND
jgi:alpha/beta superfamily hydrolase